MMLTLDTPMLSPESETSYRQCFIENPSTGEIRFTAKGFKEYGHRFAAAGIDINRIRSLDEFKAACSKSEYVVWDELRAMVEGHKELEEILKPLWS